MAFRAGAKTEKCARLLPQAIQEVSSRGTMKFSVRNLFYKTREHFLRKYPTEDFYKSYSSFTQDFLTRYQAHFGKITGMLNEPRGKWVTRTDFGEEKGDNDGSTRVWSANKVIIIEKAGLFQVMKENDFHLHLDALIITTQGFSSEMVRNTLIQAEKDGFPIFVIHDYDINGILIRTTLHERTKRRNSSLEKETIDLGFSYCDICELGLRAGAEPVKLSKEDLGKLRGLHYNGTITDTEGAFLENRRVELNALEPLRLLVYLKDKLIELGYGKTLPEQADLDSIAEEFQQNETASTKSQLSFEIQESAFSQCTSWMEELEERIEDLRRVIRHVAEDCIGTNFLPPRATKITVEQVEVRLLRQTRAFWTRPARNIAYSNATRSLEDAKADFETEVMVLAVIEDLEVQASFRKLREFLRSLFEQI